MAPSSEGPGPNFHHFTGHILPKSPAGAVCTEALSDSVLRLATGSARPSQLPQVHAGTFAQWDLVTDRPNQRFTDIKILEMRSYP